MGLLDQVTSALGGGGSPGGGGGMNASLLGAVMKLVNNPQVGGVGGLLSKLQSSGIGNQVQSWIGTGANQPVTGQQLSTAIGDDHMDQVARDAGLSKDDASHQLAGILPGVVDRLTPNGQVPPNLSQAGGGSGGLMDLLKNQLGGAMRQ